MGWEVYPQASAAHAASVLHKAHLREGVRADARRHHAGDAPAPGGRAVTDNGQERWRWFVLTLQAILVPITASRTANLLRTIAILFGVDIAQSRYDTFMASVKLRWEALWLVRWRAIPDPLTDGRLLLGLDDAINPKTGRKVFACQVTFEHAAKTNQTQ